MDKTPVAYPNMDLILFWLVTGQLWHFGVGEDPNWGKRPIDQIALLTTIHELATRITDEPVRKQVQTTVTNAMTTTTQKMAKAA